MHRMRVATCIVLVFTAGCAGWQPAAVPDAGETRHLGTHHLRVTLADRSSVEMDGGYVEDGLLYGRVDGRYRIIPMRDVTALEKRPSGGLPLALFAVAAHFIAVQAVFRGLGRPGGF